MEKKNLEKKFDVLTHADIIFSVHEEDRILIKALNNSQPPVCNKKQKIGCLFKYGMIIKIYVLRSDLYCCDFSKYPCHLVLTIISMCVLHA